MSRVAALGLWLAAAAEGCVSPAAVAASPDGGSLYIACAGSKEVVRFELAGRRIRERAAAPYPPTGLAISADGLRVYATCAAPSSRVLVLEAPGLGVAATLPAGHTAMAPVLSPDGRRLYVSNRFDDSISVIDLDARKELRRAGVRREPVAAAITKDGRYLLVANHMHDGRADGEPVAAVVSVIDTAAGRVWKELPLPSGSGVLADIRVSPDGKWACLTHLIARFQVPTSQLERGWMNNNAATFLDLGRMEILNTVLLDEVTRGAANPWGVGWSGDSRKVVVACAGSHQVSVVDFDGLRAKLARLPEKEGLGEMEAIGASRVRADVPNDLSFLTGVRRQVGLPEGDLGPRAVAVAGARAYAANYFSGTLSEVDLALPQAAPESIALGPPQRLSGARLGELYFHDARLCFQKWQSCASCHPGEGRSDSLNWDLLNDGIANPKNNRSLLLAHRTPPSMSLGVREQAEAAVRAGIKYILFTQQPEEVAAAMDEYLASLQPVPSPHLVNGKLSPAAARGKRLFEGAGTGCAVCHPSGGFTDLKSYDVGTNGRFDTPTLIEVWRTAPYLHDGSAATMLDVLTTGNRDDQHGKTSHLSPDGLRDLAEYVLSL